MRIRIRGSRQRTRQRFSPSRIDLGGISRPPSGSFPPTPCSSPIAVSTWQPRKPGTMRNACHAHPDNHSSPSSAHASWHAHGSALQASEIRRLRFTHDLHAHHRQQARKHRRMNTLAHPTNNTTNAQPADSTEADESQAADAKPESDRQP